MGLRFQAAGSISESSTMDSVFVPVALRPRIFVHRTCNLGLRQGGRTRQNEPRNHALRDLRNRETMCAVAAIGVRDRAREPWVSDPLWALEMRWQKP